MGPADGAVKNAIFWDNGAKFYNLGKRVEYQQGLKPDAIDRMKAAYKKSRTGRSNNAYGYVHRG